MPLIVTDSAVLAQIADDDGLASSVDAQFAALGDRVPASTLAAWQARLVAYRQWRAIVVPQLEGGLLFGAWFGVPQMGDQALAWAQELAQTNDKHPDRVSWRQIANDLAAGRTAANAANAVNPNDVADDNLDVLGSNAKHLELSGGTTLVLAAALGLGLLMAVKS